MKRRTSRGLYWCSGRLSLCTKETERSDQRSFACKYRSIETSGFFIESRACSSSDRSSAAPSAVSHRLCSNFTSMNESYRKWASEERCQIHTTTAVAVQIDILFLGFPVQLAECIETVAVAASKNVITCGFPGQTINMRSHFWFPWIYKPCPIIVKFKCDTIRFWNEIWKKRGKE